MDGSLVGADPAQLGVAGDMAPERSHVGGELVERPAENERLHGPGGCDYDLGPAAQREGQALAAFPRIRLQLDVRGGVVRVGIHRVRTREVLRRREADIANAEVCDLHRSMGVAGPASREDGTQEAVSSSSRSALVCSKSGSQLFAWSYRPPFTESTTNEYHGQECFRSVSEKYASASGCEW